MFTIVILTLVAVLMAAKNKLVDGGDVNIAINGDPAHTLTVPSGGTLLGVLANNKIFISPRPAAAKGVAGSASWTWFPAAGRYCPPRRTTSRAARRAGAAACPAK